MKEEEEGAVTSLMLSIVGGQVVGEIRFENWQEVIRRVFQAIGRGAFCGSWIAGRGLAYAKGSAHLPPKGSWCDERGL